MADTEQVERLLAGVEGWNRWRKCNPNAQVNLNEAELANADLHGANLHQADLADADLRGATLSNGVLTEATLARANLREARLMGADLSAAASADADLTGAYCGSADFSGAYLGRVTAERADLRNANLHAARLIDTNLANARLEHARADEAVIRRADLTGANLAGVFLLETHFADVDLTNAMGLIAMHHGGPSTVSQRTLARSRGLPDEFLRGCGLQDWEIESYKLYDPNITPMEFSDVQLEIFDRRQQQPLQIHNVFISYSHEDSQFVDALARSLDAAGIRFWRDIHDAVAGRLDKNVERGMRNNPIVIVVLSKNSVTSPWVEHEVALATELHREFDRDTLCPIALDDEWKTCDWDARLRTQLRKYNILPFHEWKEPGEFGKTFRRLVKGLDLFYKRDSNSE